MVGWTLESTVSVKIWVISVELMVTVIQFVTSLVQA